MRSRSGRPIGRGSTHVRPENRNMETFLLAESVRGWMNHSDRQDAMPNLSVSGLHLGHPSNDIPHL